MERRLISALDQSLLLRTPAANLASEIARVRAAVDAPASWRIDPALAFFYNPSGMSPAAINTYESAQRAVYRDQELARKAIVVLAVAIHKRFKAVVPTDTTTAAQWEAAVRAEWDAL